jgi:hypothetical protein
MNHSDEQLRHVFNRVLVSVALVLTVAHGHLQLLNLFV